VVEGVSSSFIWSNLSIKRDISETLKRKTHNNAQCNTFVVFVLQSIN